METNTIHADVKDRVITLRKYVPPTAGNVSHDFLAITLDSEWASLEKRVTFYGNGAEITLPWDGATAIEIPWECLRVPGSVSFTVVGSFNGVDRLVTEALLGYKAIRVATNGEDEGVEPSAPTPDIIRSAVQAAERATEVSERVEGAESERAAMFERNQRERAERFTEEQAGRASAFDASQEPRSQEFNADMAAWDAQVQGAADNANQAAADIRGMAERGEFDGSDASATDVQINGTSITQGGVANIPFASKDTVGLCQAGSGVSVNNAGKFFVEDSTITRIANRQSNTALTLAFIDQGVKAALTDGKGAAWTDAEKLAARERIGLPGGWRKIADIETEEDVNSITADVSGVTEMRIAVKYVAATNASNTVRLQCSHSIIGAPVHLIYSLRTGDTYFQAHYENTDGFLMAIYSSQTAPGSINGGFTNPSTYSQMMSKYGYPVELKLFCDSGKVMGAGTKIEVWGR